VKGTDAATAQARSQELAQRLLVLRQEIGRALLGQERLIEDLLVAVVAGGHVLLEGLPGLGKTLLVKSLANCLGLQFSRIQFTPDLMPADVTGTRVIEDHGGERRFRFQKGPVFGNLVLADEINRATPKTQSALLEAMQEHSVTVGGEAHRLPEPFAVIATQNPIELEGTFPLPEAQLDRFLFKLVVGTPPVDEMVRILGATTKGEELQLRPIMGDDELLEFQALSRQVLCGEHLLRYVAELLHATHGDDPDAEEDTRRLVRYGASPRAGQAIVLAGKVKALLAGRPAVSKEDLDQVMLPALQHRVVLSFEADSEGIKVPGLLPRWQRLAEKRARV
jgi:MoxR-like ATPase